MTYPVRTYEPSTTSRHFGAETKNFKNGHIWGESPYYRPWIFGVLRELQSAKVWRSGLYYRLVVCGEMFKRSLEGSINHKNISKERNMP